MNTYMKCISVTSRCANQYRNEGLEKNGLKGYQYAYILHVCHNPGISQEQLARIIYINKSNVTRQLAVLEQEGYFERRASEADRRVILVYPTQKAYDILPTVLGVLRKWNEYITEDFTEEEKDTLLKLLVRITDKAKAYAENKEI